jgi:hypothetical protein
MVPSRRIAIASGAPTSAIDMVRDLSRAGTFDVQHLDRILRREVCSPRTLLDTFLTSCNKDLILANQAAILARKALATSSPPDSGPPYASCAAVHPWIESCMHVLLPRFFTVFKRAFPIYGALHFVPMMLFKRHALFKSPPHMFGCARWATIRSSAFLAALIAIYQSMYFHFLSTPSMSSQYLFVAWFCSKHYIYRLLVSQSLVKVPRRVLDVFASKYSYALGGFLGALSLFVEEKRRPGELAMYVLPKGLESAWLTARGKGWVFHAGYFGEMLVSVQFRT